MLKKNKKIAAFIAAVLILALTVAGSLTVSAASTYCAWRIFDYSGKLYGSFIDDGYNPFERDFTASTQFYILANGISVDAAGTDMIWKNNTGLEFVGLSTASKSSTAAIGWGIGTTHTFGELVYSSNGNVSYFIALNKGNSLFDDINVNFSVVNNQITAKVTSWDSNCTGLFFVVDGVKVGSDFMAHIVGPVSEHIGTLAYCPELTTGYHVISVAQTNSANETKVSSKTGKYYTTVTGTSYVCGGKLTLAETPENLSNLNLYTKTYNFLPDRYCYDFNYSFKHGDYFYFVTMDFDYDETSLSIGRYRVGDTTLACNVIKVKYSSEEYYFGINDVVYYNSCLYFYGVGCSASKYGYSSSYHKTSSLDTYLVPMSAIINAFSSNTSSTTSIIYLTSYNRVYDLPCYEYFDDYYIYKTSRIFIDDTFYHLLLVNSDATYFDYCKIEKSSGLQQITQNAFPYFDARYTSAKNYGRFYVTENNGVGVYDIYSLSHTSPVENIQNDMITDLAPFFNITSKKNYDNTPPVGSSIDFVGGWSFYTPEKFFVTVRVSFSYTTNSSGSTSSGSQTFLCLYDATDGYGTLSVISPYSPDLLSDFVYSFGDIICSKGKQVLTGYTMPIIRYYTEAEYQAALAAGACDKTHVTDTNNDGYDDSSYTAGYNSGAATASTASPLLSYSQGQLSWRKIKDSNPVYIEYITYQDYLTDAGYTALPNSTDYSDGYWEIDSFDFDWEKSQYSKWVQFRLVEATDSGDKYSNTIQIDICLETHVVDADNDGYDDSAFSAGYTAGGVSGVCSLIHVVDNDNDTYDDVSFTAGKQAGINYQKNRSSDSGVADFVTKILGAFTGSALYVGSNISVAGVTLLTIVGLLVIGVVVILLIKFLKGR